MLQSFALVLLALFGGPLPTPIGAGPHYLPAAAAPPSAASCRAGSLAAGGRAHLELFARRQVVVVPAAIGLRQARLRLGRVVGAACRARIWTLDPSGILHFTGRTMLAQLFRIWRRQLRPRRMLGFHGQVHVYLGGREWRGDPRELRIRNGAEIVLEVDGYVPPHRSFLFPPR